jgi:hypothetical protein
MSAHVMNYIETDAPDGLTLRDWRRTRTVRQPRRRLGLRIFIPARRPAFAG